MIKEFTGKVWTLIPSYKLLWLGLVCCCFSLNGLAQPFEKAPIYKKKIRKIVEWNRGELSDKAIKGATSIFDKQGRLKSYTSAESSIHYDYNQSGKLVKVKEYAHAKRLTQISYKPKVTISELSFRGKTYKTESYYKASKLVEQKILVKGAELGNKYLLKERLIFSYNKFDSLAQETHYVYSIPKKKAKAEKRKTIYKYNAQKKLSNKIFYDTDGSIRKKTDYHYNGKLLMEQRDFFPAENRKSSTKYLYKSDKLWQKIAQDKHGKNVWIYADDRLIRLRSYFGDKLFQVVDYQYFYFE